MIIYIFNPQAKNANKLRKKIKNYLLHLGLDGEFIEAKKPEDVATISKEALDRKVDTLVAIGGDGIVNRVIQVIANQDIKLGVIPIGKTNFLASFLGITNWKKGCEILLKQENSYLNLGRINNKKYFISSVEMDGIEKKEIKSRLASLLNKKAKRKSHHANICIENEKSKIKMDSEISSVIITSMPFPTPKNIDLEEIVSKEELNIIIKTNHKGAKKEDLTVLSGKKIGIGTKQKMEIRADGDLIGKSDVDIEIVPRALRVIIPKKK